MRKINLAEKGLFLYLLTLAQDDPPGELRHSNGLPMTIEDIAKNCQAKPSYIARAMLKLEGLGIVYRKDEVWVVSNHDILQASLHKDSKRIQSESKADLKEIQNGLRTESTFTQAIENTTRLPKNGGLYQIPDTDVEGENKKEKDVCTERKKSATVPNPTVPKIYFSIKDRQWYNITEQDKAGWAKAFPACDIEVELLQAGEWLISNPTKDKTQYRRYITGWLSRQQDRGGTRGGICNGKNSAGRVIKTDLYEDVEEYWKRMGMTNQKFKTETKT